MITIHGFFTMHAPDASTIESNHLCDYTMPDAPFIRVHQVKSRSKMTTQTITRYREWPINLTFNRLIPIHHIRDLTQCPTVLTDFQCIACQIITRGIVHELRTTEAHNQFAIFILK
ncbi:hypothetical protein [Chitinimonas sp. JJ19]|uniref:hypothetical protein n=1 Tax=Chitinimonas sp. JJ19 TaxID=3109352 RepID=UPI002FFE2919